MRLPAAFILTWAAFCGCGRNTPAPSSAAPAAASPPAAAVAMDAPGPHAKSAPPIDIDLWFESEPKPGAPVKVGIAAVPRIDLPSCTIALLNPDGLPVVQGPTEWTGPLARNRRRTLFVTVQVPDARRCVVRGKVEGVFPDGARVSRAAERVINPAGAAKPSAEPGAAAGVRKTNDRGEAILEFPAETPK